EFLTGRNQNFLDYFFEEVLDKQCDKMQSFLLKTSILQRMNPLLADAVAGTNDGAQLLQQLERENLFLVSLDHQKNWYRYHHLFQEFLQMQFLMQDKDNVQSAQMAAGKW